MRSPFAISRCAARRGHHADDDDSERRALPPPLPTRRASDQHTPSALPREGAPSPFFFTSMHEYRLRAPPMAQISCDASARASLYADAHFEKGFSAHAAMPCPRLSAPSRCTLRAPRRLLAIFRR